MNRDESASRARSRSPITLAFLFYLVTIGGILSACLRPLADSNLVTGVTLAVLIGIGIGLGVVSGAVLGLFFYRSLIVGLIGAGVGVAVGGLAGALSLVETQRFVELGFIAFGGSWLLIVIMCISAHFRPA